MPPREVKLGETLSRLIEERGFSRNRQEILRVVGVSAAALSQYTRNQTRPSFQKLLALAEFFGVSLDYLVYGEGAGEQRVDHSSMAQLIDVSLTSVRTRVSQHSALVGRIGRVLADRVDSVARELAESATAGREGLIQDDESARLERFCVKADILSVDLGFDLIEVGGESPAAGAFLDIVAGNLARGCRYRFLVPGDIEDKVPGFRGLLTDAVGEGVVWANCEFRRTDHPVVTGVGLYQLDVQRVRPEEAALYAQLSDYISSDGGLAYAIRPNSVTNSDMLMTGHHRDRARTTFDRLWRSARGL